MKNKLISIFIVAFFSGATLNVLFSIVYNTILRNQDFQINDWEFSNYIVFFTSIILVYEYYTHLKLPKNREV